MKLTVDGLTIQVPEQFVEEYLNLMQCDRGYLSGRLTIRAGILRQTLIENNRFHPDTFESKVIDYFDNELEIYRQ